MLRLCPLLLLVATLSAAVEVPLDVATALKAAQDAPAPDKALVALAAYAGPAHPLIDLAMAQAHHRLATEGPEGERSGHRRQAGKDYEAALQLDPELRPARWGLARLAADEEDWKQASALASAGLDANQATAGELEFAANAALRAGDRRLAAALVDAALVRYPRDDVLRRVDLALLVDAGRNAEARSAALDLLDRVPTDRDLWLHLARADQTTGHEAESLAALEAALSCDGGGDAKAERALRRRLAEGLLASGWPQAALPHFIGLMGEPLSTESLADAPLVEIAVRCASEAGDLVRAHAWIEAVPAKARTRGEQLLAARIAVEQGDTTAAAAALDALVGLGESDPGVLAWAGELAETRGEEARAAAFYGQAMAGSGKAADAARLRLAALRLRQGLLDDAATLIDAHLARNPDDVTARSLRAALDLRRPSK
jgi:predicted Zn-dependent protease